MLKNFKFGRLLKGDLKDGFTYTDNKGNEADWSGRALAMVDVGTHWSVTIKNYLSEDILIVNSLRNDPIRVSSINTYNRYMTKSTTNIVVIELRQRENVQDKDGGGKIKTQRKIEIRCPGHYLQNHSLFIEELGCYLTIEDRLHATQECVAQDARYPDAQEVDVPRSAVKPNPAKSFGDYEWLVRNCIERADRIQIRVGHRVDVDPSRIPEKILNMRIAVGDRDFSPYHSNRMVYDPTLADDEFVVENLFYRHSDPITSTFTILQQAENRAFFINTTEHETLGGTLFELSIFADPSALTAYLFAHRSEKLYDELTERLIDKNGGHILNKKLIELEDIINTRDAEIKELRGNLKFEQETSKEYKRRVGILEDNLGKMRNHHDASMSYDAVMKDLENQREKLRLEEERLASDREELSRKQEQAKATHRSTMFKAAADAAKSIWGILGILATASVAIVKIHNKLNSKPV